MENQRVFIHGSVHPSVYSRVGARGSVWVEVVGE